MLSKAQKDAKVAIAAYESALESFQAAVIAELGELSSEASDEEADAYFEAEEDIHQRFELDRLSDERIAAEEALIAAAFDKLMPQATAAQKKELEFVRAKRSLPSIRKKVIDIALRVES